jgi:hypothetical protein
MPGPSAVLRSPPSLRAATFADFEQIHRLESLFFTNSLPPAERRGLFEDNPLWPGLERSWPLGWVLEDDGRIVGVVSNIPSAYVLHGEELLCANGHVWAVLEHYRGYAAELMDEYFSQEGPDLLISAKVGVSATAVWSAYAQRVPVGDWSTAACAITGYREFARAGLDRKGVPFARSLALPVAAALRARDARSSKRLPDRPPFYEFGELDGFDPRFDEFWSELVRQNPHRLMGVRNAATLRWHYGIPYRQGRLWVLAAVRNRMLRAYCVLKYHRHPDVNSMKIVDFQTVEPDVDLLPGLLELGLRRASAEKCAFLEQCGVGLPKMRWFEYIAPYRPAKGAWSFYYVADEPSLAERLADPAVWVPSEYDGDASYE